MDRGEIPGFWYSMFPQPLCPLFFRCNVAEALRKKNIDEKKRKYFKILPNYVAPKGVEYSREGVRKGREREVVSSFYCI